MKTRLTFIVCLIMVITAVAGFAATTLTTIYPQKSLTVGDQPPTTNNTVEVVDGSVNVSGTDSSGNPSIPACYKIGGTQALATVGTNKWLIGASSSSNVGINNTSPAQALDIVGTIRFGGTNSMGGKSVWCGDGLRLRVCFNYT